LGLVIWSVRDSPPPCRLLEQTWTATRGSLLPLPGFFVLGFMIYGVGLEVKGLTLSLRGLRFKIWSLVFGILGIGFWVWGLGFGVLAFRLRVQG